MGLIGGYIFHKNMQYVKFLEKAPFKGYKVRDFECSMSAGRGSKGSMPLCSYIRNLFDSAQS